MQYVAALATLILGALAWWRYGPLAAAVVGLIGLLMVAVVTGIRAEAAAQAAEAEAAAQAAEDTPR